jgi:hypothetical protein
MMNLNKLDEFLGKKEYKPSDAELAMFFFLEKGVDYNMFRALPLPYIFSMLKVNGYMVEQQEKKRKK